METRAKISWTGGRVLFLVFLDLNGPLATSPSELLEKVDNQTTTPEQGFPEAALDVATTGDLTKANKPTTANSIGLDVEWAYFISHRIDGCFN